MSDVLTRICTEKADHVREKKAAIPQQLLEERLTESVDIPRGFIHALQNKHTAGQIALVAEVKKASPSKGIIRADFDPVAIAKDYQTAGAACLSVLTDTPYFQGQDAYLQEIRKHVSLPLLRKDFMIDPYQIYESRVLGADCILIIMAALSDSQANELYKLARKLDMDVLVEIHNQEELERALLLSPAMIGINSRNLKTLEVDITIAHDLLKKIPESVVKIAESGIHTHEDVLQLQNSGAKGFLVGESLMRQENIIIATQKLLGTY